MAFNPTPVQEKAIYAKGNVLVSAAAGSGKTAVLTERVVKRICDKENGVSADKILVVTFTKAAAAEMRSRIEARLSEECEKNPDDSHLMRQMLLFSNAKICTIDSFCIELVRENFDKLGINPDFKIVDDSIYSVLCEKAIEKTFEKEFLAQEPSFLKLLEIVGSNYDDSVLADYVKKIHAFTTTLPNPDEWLSCAAKANSLKENSAFLLDYSFELAEKRLNSALFKIRKATEYLRDCGEIGLKYVQSFIESEIRISKLIEDVEKKDWDSLYYGVSSFEMIRLPSIRGANDDPVIRTAKHLREIAKNTVKKLGNLFFDEWSNILQAAEMLDPLTEKLSCLVKEYNSILNGLLRERNLLTFYNAEQMAFDLLCDYKNNEIFVKDSAKEYIKNFDEVLVDEYQDTNVLQDVLFKVLSDDEKKLFIVGDVKQSIYRFRGAEPSNFLNKKHRYLPFDVAEDFQSKKIILGNNFRSREEICEYINFFFSHLMTAETGAIDYDEEERLYPLAEYPKAAITPVDVTVLEIGDAEEKNTVAEANFIALKIKQIMKNGNVVRDEKDTKKLRPAKFSDFAILLRNTKDKAVIYAEQLENHGIPVDYSTGSFLENREISTVLSFLDILDNPTRDISLVSVMTSPLYSFTADELALIRTNNRRGSFYSCVTAAAVNGDEHCKAFLKSIDSFRRKLLTMPLSRFLYYFYDETDFLDLMRAMNKGEERKRNLLKLVELSETYEENEGRSIGGFVSHIKNIDEKNIVTETSSNENSVKIMTVHHSKGLQFPICIFAACNSKFSKQDQRSSLIIDKDLYFSYRFYDSLVNRKFTTLQRQLLLERINQLQLEEELRLAYVAMTRAQDKLILLLSVNDPTKKIQEMSGTLSAFNGEIDSSLFAEATTFADWILMTSLIHPDGERLRKKSQISLSYKEQPSSFNARIYNYNDFITVKKLFELKDDETQAEFVGSKELRSCLEMNLNYQYPFGQLLSVASKSSVSKLANSAEDRSFSFEARPSFACSDGADAAKRGTATHKIMQFIDFKKAQEDLEAELERLIEWQFITENDAEISNKEHIKAFLESELCNRILESNTVKREMRFLTEKPATEIDTTLDEKFSKEMIVIQGAVDCLFIEDEKIVVVDFKTDRVKSKQQLADSYREQLSIYAGACEKIFSKPVKEKILYSFHLGKSILV